MPVATQTTELSALKEILCSRSVRFGEVTLSSGKISDVYVDCKLTTLSAEAMPLIGRVFLNKMAERGWTPQSVGGLTVGADPIAMSIARESLSGNNPINAFIVRKEPKKHGMQRFIEGIENTAGCSVVIIDDVCTSGGSTVQAIERARDAKMDIIGAICLVDRESGATRLLRERFGLELLSIFTLSDLKNIQR
jgi:orotate phosphoribosyltransferase